MCNVRIQQKALKDIDRQVKDKWLIPDLLPHAISLLSYHPTLSHPLFFYLHCGDTSALSLFKISWSILMIDRIQTIVNMIIYFLPFSVFWRAYMYSTVITGRVSSDTKHLKNTIKRNIHKGTILPRNRRVIKGSIPSPFWSALSFPDCWCGRISQH